MTLIGFMVVFWVLVVAVVAFFVVRELRAKRKGPAEFDRFDHEAARQAGVNQDVRGPNGGSQTWVG